MRWILNVKDLTELQHLSHETFLRKNDVISAFRRGRLRGMIKSYMAWVS